MYIYNIYILYRRDFDYLQKYETLRSLGALAPRVLVTKFLPFFFLPAPTAKTGTRFDSPSIFFLLLPLFIIDRASYGVSQYTLSTFVYINYYVYHVYAYV